MAAEAEPDMKRVLATTLMVLGLLFVGLLSTVLLRADSGELPAPDPSMLIHLADGTQRPLGEVLERVTAGQPLPAAAPLLDVRFELEPEWQATLTPEETVAHLENLDGIRRALESQLHGDEHTVFRLAENARRAGRFDEAAALYLSIPEDDPRYARSRRRLAWDVLTKGQGQPQRAVAYANEAVALDPFNGNSWQDLARVYGATLGLDLD